MAVTVDDNMAEVFERVCSFMDGPALTDGEVMTPEKLLGWLFDDVRYVESRPGSWEGANMKNVLESHGFIAG